MPCSFIFFCLLQVDAAPAPAAAASALALVRQHSPSASQARRPRCPAASPSLSLSRSLSPLPWLVVYQLPVKISSFPQLFSCGSAGLKEVEKEEEKKRETDGNEIELSGCPRSTSFLSPHTSTDFSGWKQRGQHEA